MRLHVPPSLTLNYPGSSAVWVRGLPTGRLDPRLAPEPLKRYVKPGSRWHVGTFYPKGAQVRYGRDRWRSLRPSVGVLPPKDPDVWERITAAAVPALPPVPKVRSRKRRGSKRRGAQKERAYAPEPMNRADAALFWRWQKDLAGRGKSYLYPGGARETFPGSWRGEVISPQDVAQAEPLWVREWLQELAEQDWGAWVALWADKPSWAGSWAQGLRDDDRTRGDYQPIDASEWATIWQRTDPVELARVILGVVAPIGVQTAPISEGDAEDYDPLLHGNYTDWARAHGIALPGDLSAVRAPRLHHAEPIRLQTIRTIAVRDPQTGRFTGRREERPVPTMRIDLDSELGKKIRVIDDDGRHGKSPVRGALLRIETSPGRYQWIVPVDEQGHYPGAKRDDRRHVRLRREMGAESVQLLDHRTGLDRVPELLVTERSKHWELALQFQQAFLELLPLVESNK